MLKKQKNSIVDVGQNKERKVSKNCMPRAFFKIKLSTDG